MVTNESEFLATIHSLVQASRDSVFADSPQWSLGQLIDGLRALPGDALVGIDTGAFPAHFSSWRGIYAELAIVPKTTGNPPTVHVMLGMALNADGATFTGYKGGDYRMSRATPVWVSEIGVADDTAVTGITLINGVAVISTKSEEPYPANADG